MLVTSTSQRLKYVEACEYVSWTDNSTDFFSGSVWFETWPVKATQS